jgi:hypothetical protein
MTAEKVGFDGLDYSNTWIEPVGGTIMLRPAPLYSAWDTTNTGDYVRLTLADFGITATAAGWNAMDNRGAGAVRLYNPSGISASVSTTGNYTKNRTWFVSFYSYNVENKSAAKFFECGWSNTGDGSVGVSLRFWSSGLVEIYKDGVQVGTGQIGVQSGADNSNKQNDFLIIPMRKRDLLIYSITSGDGFIHTFTDIDETATNPIIIGASGAGCKFWFDVPGPSVNVELAPVKFATSGYVTSLPISLSVPPPVGATLETRANGQPGAAITNAYVFGDPPYDGTVPDVTNKVLAVEVVKTDGTAYTPNGAIRDVLIKATLVGNGSYTPFLYGISAAYAATFANTNSSEEYDITPYILRDPPPTLSVPDDPGGAEFRFTIKSPDDAQTHAALLRTLGNRPVKVKIGSNIIMHGVLLEPDYEAAFDDDRARLHCTVRDQLYAAQSVQFRERVPLDGLTLCTAAHATNYWLSVVQFLYYSAGILNADMDLDTIGFTLPAIPGDGTDEAFHAYIEIGANPYEELARIVGTYASGFVWRMKPQGSGALPKAIFKDPDTLSSTPDYTLYPTSAAAIAASKPATDIHWSYTEKPLPIEANEVRVTGYDPRSKKVIQSYSVDSPSQSPTTAPSSRPTNWTGVPIIFGVIDPRLTTQAACTQVLNSIYPRVSARYFISSFTCEMLFKTSGAPVWPSDLVAISDHRNVRISAMNVTFIVEDGSIFVARNASYTGGSILNRGGTSPQEITLNQLRAAITKTFTYPGGQFIAARTPAVTVLVP